MKFNREKSKQFTLLESNEKKKIEELEYVFYYLGVIC